MDNSNNLLSGSWIYLLAFGIAGAGWLLRKLRSRRAQSWPFVFGTVESTAIRVEGSDLTRRFPGGGEREFAEVRYSYSVQGEFFSGVHEVESEADFVFFPTLSQVLVHYDTSNPSVSFLDCEDLRSRRTRILVGQ